MKRIATVSFFIYFISNLCFSQEKIAYKVVDAITNKPIVYATIMLTKINRGTHADFNGLFQIPNKYKEEESIKISSIGYQTKEVKLAKLKKSQLNIIYLNVANNNLEEIVVVSSRKKKRKLLGVQIVKKAIINLLKNNLTEPHSYIGYYRDYQQPIGDSYQKRITSKEKIKYLNVNEAIIETFDDGFDSDKLKSKKNQSLLYKYINNKNFIQDSTLTIPYDNKSKKYSESVYITPLGGNELNILNLTNAIRNYNKMSFSYSNFFEKDFAYNHKFKVEGIIFSDEIPLYEISFYSINKKTNYEYAAYGRIYISKKNFAIHKLNYTLYYRNKKKPQYSVTIEYKANDDKMHLNYITFNNYFEATNGNYFKIDKTTFNEKQKVLKVYFNRQIDINSLEPIKRNFKIYYKNQKLKVLDVISNNGSNRIFNIIIDKNSIEKINFEKEKSNYAYFFRFDIENIKDLNGFQIDKRESIKINQYREFFVQETFVNKKLPVFKNFIDKSLPLSKSKITPVDFKNSYWLNTPLKSSKN